MQEDCKWELAILATVHGFYQKLLQEYFSAEIPTPSGFDIESLTAPGEAVGATLPRMKQWLELLDLAISPAMVRCALGPESDPEMAESLLRYFAHKKDPTAADRDKTDLVATFLYRYPRVPGQWERRGMGMDGAVTVPPFEIALTEILSDGEVEMLSAEETKHLADLDLLRAEAEMLRDFSVFLDSGITQRIRNLKRTLGESLYHPGVLAYLAPFNVAFGKKFDMLFRAAAYEIKKFAESVEQRGGSIVGQVEGMDVTVDLVAGMNEEEILSTDYTVSLERFRRVSKLKQAMAAQPKRRPAARAAAAAAGASPFVHGRLSGKAAVARKKASQPAAGPAAGKAPQIAGGDPRLIALEETRLRSVEESIRAFVRAASPKLREIVPMRFFNLLLTSAEADAFCADFLEEDSFRAECARILVRVVAVVARMSTEMEELKRKRFTMLARPHAESLLVLLQPARTVEENARLVMETAAKRGLNEKLIKVKASLQKLQERTELAERALAEQTGQATA